VRRTGTDAPGLRWRTLPTHTRLSDRVLHAGTESARSSVRSIQCESANALRVNFAFT
jgi:hypothetical protein